MAGNPKRALAALNAAPARVGRHEIRPLTLGLAAILEEIGSPLSGGPAPSGVGGWVGTLFALTRLSERVLPVLREGPLSE